MKRYLMKRKDFLHGGIENAVVQAIEMESYKVNCFEKNMNEK